MLGNFSSAARLSIFFARSEAGRSGAPEIGTEHLLLGILTADQDEHARKTIALQDGAEPRLAPRFFATETAARLRQSVTDATRLGEPIPDSAEMRLAENAESILSALTVPDDYPSVDLLHILRGLFNDKEGFVGKLLETNGITVEQIDTAIRERQGG